MMHTIFYKRTINTLYYFDKNEQTMKLLGGKQYLFYICG